MGAPNIGTQRYTGEIVTASDLGFWGDRSDQQDNRDWYHLQRNGLNWKYYTEDNERNKSSGCRYGALENKNIRM